jgi:hypothetical protein
VFANVEGEDLGRAAKEVRQAVEEGNSVRPTHGPSLARPLLSSGLVALVCGLAGAWAYSHFFGSHAKETKSSKTDHDSKARKTQESDPRHHQAESAWRAAVKGLHQSQASEREARRSETEIKAILDFFQETLLCAGRTQESTLEEAFWTYGQGKEVSLHDAFDSTEKRVADVFADRPLAEATVREALGRSYVNLGDPARAVPRYEQALALREGLQGPNHTDTGTCRNELAVAYRLADRTIETAHLFVRDSHSPAHASALAIRGATLLLERKPAEAELKLRAKSADPRKVSTR